MSNRAAHKHAWETAEAVFGIPILLSLILGYFFPLPFPGQIPRALSAGAGIMLLISSVTIIVTARRQFNAADQPTDPGKPTTQLMTTGIFSWSRNPLYLGAVIFCTSLGGLFNSLWFFIFLIPTMIAAHYILIVPEEKYLEEKFGEPYRQYCKSVRRWVGRR